MVQPHAGVRSHTARLVGVCVLLGVAIVALTGMAGVATASTDGASGQPTPTVDADIANGSNATIHPAVAESSGTQSVLVQFGPHRPAASVASDSVESHLKTRAERGRQPLEARAEATPGLRIEQSFWIANATLVSVNTSRVAPATIAAIDGVRHVGPNPSVKTAAATTPSLSAEAPTTNGSRKAITSQIGTHALDVTAPPATATRPLTAASTESNTTARASTEHAGLTATTSGPTTTAGVAQLNAPGAWTQFGTRGGGTRVAVLDTGVDPSHPDLDVAGFAAFAANGTQLETGPREYSSNGHGTHVSGTVSGGDASGPYVGVAPDTALFHAAVLTDCQSACGGSGAQILSGLQWAVEHDVDVVTMSFGVTGYVDTFVDPMYNVRQTGTAVVGSVGNAGSETSSSPGNTHDVISVGAVDTNSAVPSFSGGETITTDAAWGDAARRSWPATYTVPTVTAPGVNVRSTLPGADYGTKTGTSMAAPHAAGSLALIQAATPSQLSPAELKAALGATAVKPASAPSGHDTRYGQGTIDVAAAAATAADEPRFTVSITDTTTPVAGAPMTVTAEIANVGAATDTQAVTATIPGVGEATRSVTLAPGDTTTIDISVATAAGDAGSYTLHVASADAATTTSVTVAQPATLDVGIRATTAPVVAGESLSVGVAVTNTGAVAADQPITFSVDRTQDGQFEPVTTRRVSPSAGATRTYTFSYRTKSTDPPAIDLRVESNSSSDTDRDIVVTNPTTPETIITLSELEAPTTVQQATPFNATVTATNTNANETNSTLTLQANTTTLATETVSLGANTTETITFTAVSVDTPGTYTLSATAPGTQTTRELTVTAAPDLARFDTDQTGEIGFTEVLDAIAAHNTDTLIGGQPVSFQEVLDVIAAHNEEQQVRDGEKER